MLAIMKITDNLFSGMFILITYILTIAISTIINWRSDKIVKKLMV